MDPFEIILIQNAQKGDVASFEKLMQHYDAGILKLAQFLLHHPQDAQDACQEVFLRSFRALKNYRYESSFNTWLMRIAINICRNYLRRRKLRLWLSLDEEAEAQQLPVEVMISNEAAPDEELQKRELWQKLQAALMYLPLRQRTAFTLKHIYGYSIKEIAEIEQCAEGTIKNHLFRAAQKLKKQLLPYWA